MWSLVKVNLVCLSHAAPGSLISWPPQSLDLHVSQSVPSLLRHTSCCGCCGQFGSSVLWLGCLCFCWCWCLSGAGRIWVLRVFFVSPSYRDCWQVSQYRRYTMLELWQVSLWRIWNDSLVVELLKVDVFTKWLVQMKHGRLSICVCVCVCVCVCDSRRSRWSGLAYVCGGQGPPVIPNGASGEIWLNHRESYGGAFSGRLDGPASILINGTSVSPGKKKKKKKGKKEDVPLVEFMYLVFTRMPSESHPRRLGSLFLYLCYVFRALINFLVRRRYIISLTLHLRTPFPPSPRP